MAPVEQDRVGRVAEDYLTLIWKAEEWPDEPASTTSIASRLAVHPSTVSANLKKLARDGLLDYEPYGPVALTDAGRALAVAVVRRHRLIETYLAERLGYAWDEVHDEADRLEHAVSDRLLERIDAELGHPAADPHGDPIPAPDGSIAALEATRLRDAGAAASGVVVRVSDRENDILRYLTDRGIGLGAAVRVEAPLAVTGSMQVGLADGTVVEVTGPAAAAVWIRAAG